VPDVSDNGVHQLVVVDETSSLVSPHGCTIDVTVNLMRDTFTHAVGDVASLAQWTAIALREAGFGDLYVPARHLGATEYCDPETSRVTGHVASYQFAIVVSDPADVSRALTTVASATADSASIHDAALLDSSPQADELPLEIETRTHVVDLAKARVERLRTEVASSARAAPSVHHAWFGSLRSSLVAPERRERQLPYSST
jgi:hypothetical protein